MNKIQGIILDIDGVIVGDKIGFNSPYPNINVINKLKELKNAGIPISLCTAKATFSIGKIIEDAGLDNYHIADGGSVIINPINNSIIEQHVLDKDVVKEILEIYIKNNVYTEFYTAYDYFIQKGQKNDMTIKHEHILQRRAIELDDIAKESLKYDVTKIIPMALNETDEVRVADMTRSLNSKFTLSWTSHPVSEPLRYGIITAPGISKKQGAIEISKNMNVPLENILAVGDSTSDWQFIELCGYGGAMGNATDKLKELVKTKGEGHFFIGGDVDNNGIIEILEYFDKSL